MARSKLGGTYTSDAISTAAFWLVPLKEVVMPGATSLSTSFSAGDEETATGTFFDLELLVRPGLLLVRILPLADLFGTASTALNPGGA